MSCSPPTVPMCEICTYPSHGYHFGVVACRACAAFFRRSLVTGTKHVCKLGSFNCKIDKSERFFCRSCRFEKCVKSGMRAEKIQQNRDPISSTIQSTSFANQENEKRQAPKPKRAEKAPPLKTGALYDLDELMAEIREIFRTPYWEEIYESWKISAPRAQKKKRRIVCEINDSSYRPSSRNSESFTLKVDNANLSKLSTLRKLEYGLKYIRRTQKRRYLEVSSTMSFDQLTKARCQCLKNAARWLTFASPFFSFSESEKLLVLKSTWHVWARLERLSVTVEIFGEKTFQDKIVFTSNEDAIYLIEVVRFNLKDLDEKELRDVETYLEPLYSAIFNELAVKLLDLKPSLMEIAYMLSQLVWCVSGKTLKGASLAAGEVFMDTVSTDLHNYYESDLKLEKYAGRLLKMMAIVRTMQKTYIDYQRVMGQAEEFTELMSKMKLE